MTTKQASRSVEAMADVRARQIEQQMTEDERFSLIVSAMGQLPQVTPVRDERIPEGTP